jgi:hypothetical protein
MPTGTASDFPYILPSLPGFNQELPVPEIMSRLPPEEVGRELAAQYFDVVGTTTRIVQPWTWEEKFFLHVYHTSSPNQQRLAVVFLVFAVGALMDINRAVPDKTADEYFASARMCLTMDSTHSVTYVQCLYLCGIYLMNGPGKLARGDIVWPLLRTALGVAEAIGLHRDATHWNLDDATVTERRYVFWSIHHFDVVQSIGLGRSQCIADHCIDCVIPPHEADSAFFPKTYELIRIVSRINDLQAAGDVRGGMQYRPDFVVFRAGPTDTPIRCSTAQCCRLDRLYAQASSHSEKPAIAVPQRSPIGTTPPLVCPGTQRLSRRAFK